MTILAIDPGSRRVGVAISDPEETVALPLTVLERNDGDDYLDDLMEIVMRREVHSIVLGLPRRLDGTDGPEAESAKQLAETLRARFDRPVVLVDERFTTRIAQGALRAGGVSARKQKPVVDKVAATLLLQGYIDAQRAKSEMESKVEPA